MAPPPVVTCSLARALSRASAVAGARRSHWTPRRRRDTRAGGEGGERSGWGRPAGTALYLPPSLSLTAQRSPTRRPPPRRQLKSSCCPVVGRRGPGGGSTRAADARSGDGAGDGGGGDGCDCVSRPGGGGLRWWELVGTEAAWTASLTHWQEGACGGSGRAVLGCGGETCRLPPPPPWLHPPYLCPSRTRLRHASPRAGVIADGGLRIGRNRILRQGGGRGPRHHKYRNPWIWGRTPPQRGYTCLLKGVEGRAARWALPNFPPAR